MGNGWVEGVYPDDVDACLKGYVEAFAEGASLNPITTYEKVFVVA